MYMSFEVVPFFPIGNKPVRISFSVLRQLYNLIFRPMFDAKLACEVCAGLQP